MYAGSYSEDDLRWWADRIREWRGRDVFAYFNNDGHGHALRNALRLKELVGSRGLGFRVEIHRFFPNQLVTGNVFMEDETSEKRRPIGPI